MTRRFEFGPDQTEAESILRAKEMPESADADEESDDIAVTLPEAEDSRPNRA